MRTLDLTPAETPIRKHRIHVTISTPPPAIGYPEGEAAATFSCDADPGSPCKVDGECEAADWMLEDPLAACVGPQAPLTDGQIEVWRMPVPPTPTTAPYLWVWRYAR